MKQELMTTVQKMKDAKKAALQNELKYYSGLLAAHYSSSKIPSQHPIGHGNLIINSAISTYSGAKTTANHGHCFKSISFQQTTSTHLTNQSSKMSSFTRHKEIFPHKAQNSKSYNQRKYPCKSSMVKVNAPAFSYKSLNSTEKTSVQKNLLIKNNLDSKKQTNSGVVNKITLSNSQGLMDELGILINQLKQKSRHIDKKINYVSSKDLSIETNKPELKVATKVPTDSKIVSKSLSNISIDLKDKKSENFPNKDFTILPSTKTSNLCLLNGKKEIPQENPSVDMNGSLTKPVRDLKNNLIHQSSSQISKIAGKPCKDTCQKLSVKTENRVVLQVGNTVKTPVRKKLILHNNNVKKLSGTTLFASKYKVVNRKLQCVEQAKKVAVVSPCVKTPLKMKTVKKHIISAKKMKGGPRLITTKYKIINKKMPCSQSNSKISFQGSTKDNINKLPINNKWASSKTNGLKMNFNQLNSKYKVVNRNMKSLTVPASLLAGKYINPKVSSFVNQGRKNLHKFNASNNLKLKVERKITKSITPLKQKPLHILNLKRKKLNSLQNPLLNSKYRTVNKQPGNSLKKSPEPVKSRNLRSDHTSSIDLDLLMEIAAEKKECNDITNSRCKHVLIKRVYKSKNAIVNNNISSLQTQAAKMIKTKYSILNKKHTWQKQGYCKRLTSPKYFKGHKFNSIYQRKPSFYHTSKNKRNTPRHHVSTYFIGRSYFRGYQASKNKAIPVDPLRSVFKTPKRFVLNRKVYLKTPNSVKLSSPASKAMASRALNRSINRVLNASLKKKTSKVNIYCMFYNRFGRCNKGIKCPYVHDPSKIAVCTRFLRGTCKTKNCPFSHEICPGKMAICSFFLLGSCTKTDCPYRHEILSPNAKLCKAFVAGYCPDGKQCKRAHVLFCPQFVQGHCEKGKDCPFPHPPPKEKKAIPSSSEKKVNIEETEELTLEKMSRYFECGNDPETSFNSSFNSITVPRVRNLPEQPSFIAL